MCALIKDISGDYTLRDEHDSCWITVNNISVHVRRNSSGKAVAVDLYPIGREMEDPICGTWAEFSEAEERIRDK